jgi:hypothetical protein
MHLLQNLLLGLLPLAAAAPLTKDSVDATELTAATGYRSVGYFVNWV